MTPVLRRRHAYDASIREVGRVAVMAPPKSSLVAVVDITSENRAITEAKFEFLRCAGGQTTASTCSNFKGSELKLGDVTGGHVHVTDALNHRVAAAASLRRAPRLVLAAHRLPRLSLALTHPQDFDSAGSLPPCSTRHVARRCSLPLTPMSALTSLCRPP